MTRGLQNHSKEFCFYSIGSDGRAFSGELTSHSLAHRPLPPFLPGTLSLISMESFITIHVTTNMQMSFVAEPHSLLRAHFLSWTAFSLPQVNDTTSVLLTSLYTHHAHRSVASIPSDPLRRSIVCSAQCTFLCLPDISCCNLSSTQEIILVSWFLFNIFTIL